MKSCLALPTSYLILVLVHVLEASENLEQCAPPPPSENTNVDSQSSNFGETCASRKTSTLSVKSSPAENDHKFRDDKIFQPLESGLEFINENTELEIDETFYLNDCLEFATRDTDLPPLGLTQAFISNLKGLSPVSPRGHLLLTLGEDFLVSLYDGSLGSSANDLTSKPAWAFLPYKLKILTEIEMKIYWILKEHYDTNPNLQPFLAFESYLKDIEGSTLKVLLSANSFTTSSTPSSLLVKDPYLYIGSHPLLIYRMIRRFAEDLQPILQTVRETWDAGVLEKLYDEANPDLEMFPNLQDLEDAWKSLSRIQHGGNLKTAEFARGKFENVNTGFSVNALHALEIGMYHVEEDNLDLGIEWLHLGVESIKESPVSKRYPFIQKFFELCLRYAVVKSNCNMQWNYKHNERWSQLQEHEDKWNPGVFTSNVSLPFNPNAYTLMVDMNMKEATALKHRTSWNWATKANFIQTCSGKSLLTEEEKAKLTCWYHAGNSSYFWYINPLKVELLHEDPPVFQIHDLIGDKLIETIKENAKDELKRSTVVDRTNPKRSIVQDTRTSTQTWLYDKSHNFLLPLTHRLELMTGLHVAPSLAADAYQVALYGPSHHYDAHIDSFEDPRRWIEKGNRIVTIMAYLSDVEVGGRTGFPVLGIFATPMKGSIIMWTNVRGNVEDRDMRTWHGGCPVVLGLKWITNKWIYSKENMFKYPCVVDPEDNAFEAPSSSWD